MKNLHFLLPAVAAVASCNFLGLEQEQGYISTAFVENQVICTKASDESLDTNLFILKISDIKGSVLFEGSYGDAPENIAASPGSYCVEVRSRDFSRPEFSAPQFGDSQIVVVKSGESSSVALQCKQINSGIRLAISPSFLTSFPDGTLHLRSDEGSLLYSYSERRTAFFPPGDVSLILDEREKSSVLMSRRLEAKEILSIEINVADDAPLAGGSGFSIQVDTSRNWTTAELTIGGASDKGSTKEKAYGVSEAKAHAGEKGVWVYGYIVGGDLSSSKASFEPPFSSRTNIVIAAKSSTNTKSSCMSVQLQKGDIRDGLNLVDNPGLTGRQVWLKGDIVEAYYGIPGLQNLTEYELK